MLASGHVAVSRGRVVSRVVRVGNAQIIGAGGRKRVTKIGIESEHILAGSDGVVIPGEFLPLRVEQSQIGSQTAAAR